MAGLSVARGVRQSTRWDSQSFCWQCWLQYDTCMHADSVGE